MASTSFLCITFTMMLSISSSVAKTPRVQPSYRSLVLPLTKTSSSMSVQYITSINLTTYAKPPAVLTVDLGGENSWLLCGGKSFNASSYHPVGCNTTQCRLAKGGCRGNLCFNSVANRLTNQLSSDGQLGQNDATLQSSNDGVVSIQGLFFACGVGSVLEGLANGVVGIAGLGRSPISLPSLISNSFNLPKKFAICLSPSSNYKGAVIFGDKPYAFRSFPDASVFLLYTPLILKDNSPDYFVNLTSIRISGKDLAFDKTKLTTKFSTIKPYTILRSSIYNAVTNAFTKELSHIERVKPVTPFEICYNSKSLPKTQVGPSAPFIDLVMHQEDVFWTIYGANSLVSVKNGQVLCLGFLDGGVDAETGIVIGGHQMANSLLLFDGENMRLGFSATLLLQRTSCANYNFA